MCLWKSLNNRNLFIRIHYIHVSQIYTIIDSSFSGGDYVCSLLNVCGPAEVDVRVESRLKKPNFKQTGKAPKYTNKKNKRTKRQADLIKFAHITDTHVEPNYAEVTG